MTYPMIDPVIFEIGPLQVRWYGLMYIIGFACAYLILLYLSRRRVFRIDRNEIEDLLVYGIIGLLLGARVGYCLFYNLEFYLANPLKILAVWEGGLSFHGGLIGLVIAGAVFARIRKKSFLMLVDMGAVAATPGLFFGRIGNFINGELYGRVTDVPWGMVFPGAGPYPRHPSQLYEALLEGLVLFAVLFFL
ncbi:MAG: prolipoprotein diacylglyceryl transferase, partial [Desulfosalsimonadaceae bacterium]